MPTTAITYRLTSRKADEGHQCTDRIVATSTIGRPANPWRVEPGVRQKIPPRLLLFRLTFDFRYTPEAQYTIRTLSDP